MSARLEIKLHKLFQDDLDRSDAALQVLMHCQNYTTDDEFREMCERAYDEIWEWRDNWDPTPTEAEYK